MMRKLLIGAFVAASVLVAACDGSNNTLTAPDATLAKSGSSGSGSDAPTFLSASSDATASTTVTFYAKQGEDRMGEIFTDGSSGGNGDRIVRLRVKKDAQIVLPNGTKLEKGDSVLITMHVIDQTTLATDFQPSGLKFNGKQTAILTIYYGHTNAATTPSLESQLAIWVQEVTGGVWKKLASTVSTTLDEVQAAIPGFSNYVIAY